VSDEQNSNPQPETGAERAVDQPQAQPGGGAENASDPTPAEQLPTPAEEAPTPAEEAPTPAEEAQLAEIDHSAWMRPAVGETGRTAEVVGALAPAVPQDLDPADLPDDAVLPADSPLANPAVANPTRVPGSQDDDWDDDGWDGPGADTAPVGYDRVSPHQLAAVIGARAARARDDVPGASLDHDPEIAALAGATAAAPQRSAFARFLPWLAAALALALIAFGLVFNYTRKPVVVISETPTPSASTPEVIQARDLLNPADAAKISPVKGWAVASTADKLNPHTQITCQTNTQGQPNAVQSKLRALTTPEKNALGALHQVDNFANEADARKAYQMRAEKLASCNDVPMFLYGSTDVSGMGDEAISMTLAYQEQVTQYHVVILTRTGTTLHAVDVTSINEPVSASVVARGLAGPVNRQCERAGGQCAARPRMAATIPPPVGTPGWLVPSDLPRVTPGAGLWSGTEVANVTTKGTQCENLTLASVAGPDKREQRTFLMTQDSAAPQDYGVDQVMFSFPSYQKAKAFATTLQTNLQGCAKRQATAKVSQHSTPKRTVQKIDVVGDTLLVEQSMGGAQTARFRTAVVLVGTRVVYLVNNPSASYDMGAKKFDAVALRAGERGVQGQ